MRTHVIAAVVTGMAAVAGVADASAQSISGGLRADVGMASFVNADYETDPRFGVRAGFFADLPVSESFGIRAEAVYAMKGVKNASSSSDLTVALDYLELPVMAKVALGSGSGAFLIVGPAVGIKLSAKLKSGSESFDYGDSVYPVDFALVGGLGFETGNISFDVRYSRGLKSVYDFGDPDDSDSDDKNQVFSAGIGWRLF